MAKRFHQNCETPFAYLVKKGGSRLIAIPRPDNRPVIDPPAA